MLNANESITIAQKILNAAGPVTLRLHNGTDLTGTATIDSAGPSSNTSSSCVKIAVSGVNWVVPFSSILAVGAA